MKRLQSIAIFPSYVPLLPKCDWNMFRREINIFEMENEWHCKESFSLKWTKMKHCFHRLRVEICEKIWSAKRLYYGNQLFQDTQLMLIVKQISENKVHNTIAMAFSFSCFMWPLFKIELFECHERWSRVASLTLFTVMLNVAQLLE